MERVKVGVVGAGGIFRGAHLLAYPNVNEARLTCLCDVSKETLKVSEKRMKELFLGRAKKAADEGNADLAERLREDAENVKTYSDLSEMLSKEDLDLVDICTPTKFHSPIAIEALNHGVNVMAEKPMARTYLECLEVVEALQGMFKPFEVEDDAHIMIRFEDKEGRWCTAHVEGSWSHRDSIDTEVIGTNGIMRPVQKEGEMFLEVTDAAGGTREFKIKEANWVLSFEGEIRNMCNCVLNNTKPLCDENIGAETTAIVQSAYLSQKRGKKPVKLSEFKRYALKIREKEGKNAPDVLLRDLLKGIKTI
ncbi:hypothetical protein B6U79_02740 [Candidatus Bathyarchaeota archaeon ex4484_231]|nr:MAG: hypothetical protein B6U79_02740 [Candidatus Bathyarchaeota archaeon ex4484_231]